MRIWISLLILLVFGCKPKSEEINYHYDECAYCKMKISDSHFGAELVTSKSKVYKFDSAECLFNFYHTSDQRDFAIQLVTDYMKPGHLIDATKAYYLVSENLPSPMGGNLSAFENSSEVHKTVESKSGRVYDYNEILKQYEK